MYNSLPDASLLEFVWWFSQDEPGVVDFEEEDHWGKQSFFPHRIRVACYQHDIWLLMLTLIIGLRRICQFSPLRSCLFLFLFSHCALWKEGILSSLPLESRELCLTILRPEDLYKRFGILHEKCVCFPPCIYLFNHSLTLVCTHEYLFHTLGWNSSLFYCLIYFSSSHEEFLSWLLCPFDILHQFVYFCFIF